MNILPEFVATNFVAPSGTTGVVRAGVVVGEHGAGARLRDLTRMPVGMPYAGRSGDEQLR